VIIMIAQIKEMKKKNVLCFYLWLHGFEFLSWMHC